MQLHNKQNCWVITEGIAGTENQCIAVAEALNLEPEIKRVSLTEPWRSLSPYLGFEGPWSFTTPLEAPWPDIVIASGRKAIAAARYIKKKSPSTFVCFIQDPRINPKAFDMVAVPKHDPTRGNNVITTLAAPNRITEDKLDDAREDFAAQFEPIQSPRVAVMIGGNSKAHTLTQDVMQTLCGQLKALDCGLMISPSRRTGEKNLEILQQTFADTDAYIWDGTGANPYIAMLAWAEYILVTSDSTSMLSDAASTGKPVYMVELDGGGTRIDKMHKNLLDAGIIKRFEGQLEKWNYTPLREAEMIAKAISTKLIK